MFNKLFIEDHGFPGHFTILCSRFATIRRSGGWLLVLGMRFPNPISGFFIYFKYVSCPFVISVVVGVQGCACRVWCWTQWAAAGIAGRHTCRQLHPAAYLRWVGLPGSVPGCWFRFPCHVLVWLGFPCLRFGFCCQTLVGLPIIWVFFVNWTVKRQIKQR